MKVTKLDQALLDVFKRNNHIIGRYEKGGGFGLGLDVGSADFMKVNYREITERANVADKLITQAELEGKNVDDPEVLRIIAREVDINIKSIKRNGYLTYLIILGAIIWWLFF